MPNIKSMIDLFDNEICYFVLMAESYSDKLKNINTDSPSNTIQFYFMETCFYVNKAIHNLSLTSNCANKIYSTDYEEIFKNRKISYTRLKNIFNILDDCIKKVNSFSNVISNIDIDNNYVNLCENYKKQYAIFKKIFTDIDPNILDTIALDDK